jgi:RHS repeat-associated protein
MSQKGKPISIKATRRITQTKSCRARLGVALWSAIAFVVLVALGASARNSLLQESAVKLSFDRFGKELSNFASSVGNQISNAAAQSRVPSVPAPHGIEEGNQFIAQTSGGGGGAGGGAVYDPLRRIVKIVETRSGSVTSTKQFVWAGDQLAEERDASGSVTKRFFDMGEQISGTNYYFTHDQINSVREMTDGSGVVQSAFNYDPYGRPSQIAGTGPVPDFGFAGMYVHQPSGLNLAVNRAYDPSQGRWISRDPMSDRSFGLRVPSPEPTSPDETFSVSLRNQMEPDVMALGPLFGSSNDPVVQKELRRILVSPSAHLIRGFDTNVYNYVANNPANRTDPSGLKGIFPDPDPRLCPSAWPDVWFACAAKCAAECAWVKNKGFCFQNCYRDCIR